MHCWYGFTRDKISRYSINICERNVQIGLLWMIEGQKRVMYGSNNSNLDVQGCTTLALTDISGLSTSPTWTIRAFGLKLWLHISTRGNNIGISPCRRNALEDAADIAHPREDECTSCPQKGWSPEGTLPSFCFTSFSNSRRKRHLLLI
jgi:hypothetical protein